MIAIRHPPSLDIRPHRATLAFSVSVRAAVSNISRATYTTNKMVSCGTCAVIQREAATPSYPLMGSGGSSADTCRGYRRN